MAGICQNCFIKFNELDEHYVLAQNLESELLQIYENANDNRIETKFEIKREQDDFVEVMIEDDDDDYSENFDIFQQSESNRALRPSKSEKRSYKRKKDLDEGLIVFAVDGHKIYQCEICKVSKENSYSE